MMDWNGLKGDYLEFFSRDDLDAIHATALKILKEVGLKVTNDQAFEIFAGTERICLAGQRPREKPDHA